MSSANEVDTLKKVAKDMDGKFATAYNEGDHGPHARIELKDGSGRRVDVYFSDSRYRIYTDYSEKVIISYIGDADIDSETIERTVSDLIKKDYQ